MSTTLAAALIAGGSAVTGGLVVAVSNYAINQAQSRAAAVAELRAVLSAVLSVLGQIETELRTEPRSRRIVRTVNEQMQSRFPQIDYVAGRLHRRIFRPNLDGLIARFHDAIAATVLVAPPELLPALEIMADAMGGPVGQTDEWWSVWGKARVGLVVASRRAVGFEVPERTQSAQPPCPS